MTDKQILETLKNIKKFCENFGDGECASCKFDGNKDMFMDTCQIVKLARSICRAPIFWDIEEIERIINE